MNLFNVFKRHKKLWVKRVQKDDYWCAGGYIINKRVLKPFIDAILRPMHINRGSALLNTITEHSGDNAAIANRPLTQSVLNIPPHSTQLVANIIAGYESPCVPKHCCSSAGKLLSLIKPECVRAPRGYQSDHFLFSILFHDTYMLTVPIMTGSVYGNTSTFHQQHVGLHVSAFNRINTIVNEMILPDYDDKRPVFLNRQCRYNSSSDVDFNIALNRAYHLHL
jgi:hypothetical protein